MTRPHDSLIVQTLTRLMLPVIQLYGLYVLFFGQYGPGGGFVGGVIFGASLILSLLVFGLPAQGSFIGRTVLYGDGLGLVVFAGIGVVSILWGGEFLHYALLHVPGLTAPSQRSLGIVGAQIGVAMDVAATAVSIFISLSPEGLEADSHD